MDGNCPDNVTIFETEKEITSESKNIVVLINCRKIRTKPLKIFSFEINIIDRRYLFQLSQANFSRCATIARRSEPNKLESAAWSGWLEPYSREFLITCFNIATGWYTAEYRKTNMVGNGGEARTSYGSPEILNCNDNYRPWRRVQRRLPGLKERKKIYHREGTKWKRRVINGEVLLVVDLTIV